MNTQRTLWIVLGALGLISMCCVGVVVGAALTGGRQPPAQNAFLPEIAAPQPTPIPTATAVPTPLPPLVAPDKLPTDSRAHDLVQYANVMQPLLAEAGVIVQRDAKILEASEEGNNDAILCDGRLENDHTALQGVMGEIKSVSPPGNTSTIHDLLVRSGDAWTEALDNVEQFCQTGNQLHKIPAALKFWEAAATFQEASNRFWLLVIAEGIEAYVQR